MTRLSAALVVVTAVWLAVSAGFGAAVPTAGAAEPAPEVGRLAPDFTLPDLQAGSVRLYNYQGRKAVLINFWATWCVPCRQEMPTLERLSRERRDTLEVLGVNLDTVATEKVRVFVRELRLTFPIVLDPETVVARLYRVRGLPTSYIVDREGVVRYREVGYRDWTRGDAQAIVDEALRPR